MRNLWKLSPLCLIAMVACAGGNAADTDTNADDLVPAQLSARPQARIIHSMPKNGVSTASIRTLPNAACSLRVASEAAGQEHLRVYADDEGVVRLQLHDIEGTAQTGELALDCADAAGKTLTHALQINVADNVRGQLPAATATAGKPVLPQLKVDPMSLSAAQITSMGYPPRPSPTSAPAQYQKWLTLVSRQPTVMAPKMIDEPTRSHGFAQTDRTTVNNGNGTSNNWSGYVISTPSSAVQYGEIFGAWRVPVAHGISGWYETTHSSTWVGIDGWGTPDVVQAGTDQNTTTVLFVTVSSYDAWTEWYPFSSKTISNFPVSSNDLIYTWVWVGDAAGNWTPNGGYGWFLVWNTTQNVITPYLSTKAPAGTYFNGHQAEWVVERPTVNGNLATLTNYVSAQITDCWAYDFADHAHYYTSDYSVGLNMMNGKTLLSSVAPIDSMSMQFVWHNFN